MRFINFKYLITNKLFSKLIVISILNFSFLIHNSVTAQTVLESYVQEGLKNSLALKQENLEIEKAIESINQAKALFYPRLTFAPTYSLATGGRKLEFPVGDLLNPVYSTLNQITKSSSFPQIENVSQQLAPNNFHDTKFSVQYSIYNPEIKYNYLIQKQLVSVQEAKKKVLENEIRYNITTAYYQYLQTFEALKVYDNARQTLNELVRLNQKLVNNQVATKDVVVAAEYEISKLNQQQAVMKKNQNLAKSYLIYMTNEAPPAPDGGAKIEIEMALKNATVSQQMPPLGVGGLVLLQLDKSIEVSKSAVLLQEKAGKLPSVFVGGNAGFQGFGYTFSNQGYAVAQFGLSWDLFKGYERKSKIQQAKIQTEILQTKKSEIERQIELQATQAFLELQATRENLTLTADAQTKAQAYFKVLDSRYKNGNVLFIEWLKAQNEVTAAQLQQSLAQFDVLIKQSLLDKVLAN
jgi:outer membrane protein